MHHPFPRRNRLPGLIVVAVALAITTLLLTSCSSDSPDENRVDGTTAAASPTPIPLTQTPRVLPVTPVSVRYDIADPSFEALPGARAIFGQSNGAGYRIEVPDAWNGDVVYFAHGFRGNVPQLTIDPPPLRDWFIDHGYAWAASSFSVNGYEPGVAARDTLALRDVFAREVGAPKRQYIYGQSMGGHVVSLSLEQYPQAYDGALSECGVVSGHEILDYFLSWGALSSYLTGVDLYDATSDAGAFAVKMNDEIRPRLGALDEPTASGRVFQSAIERLTGGPRPFFLEGLDANYDFNFTILVNAVAAAGPANAASQNIDTRYAVADGLGVTSDEINRNIPRIEANAKYRDIETYPEFANMTGKIERPLLTLHDTGDLFVPISLEQSYARLVAGAGHSDLLVQRAIRRAGHCDFSYEERVRGFEDLANWVVSGKRPAGDDLSGDLTDVGRAFTDPMEIDDPGATSSP